MERYVDTSVMPNISFDTSEFACIELLHFTTEVKESKVFGTSVTVGGSIVTHEIVPIYKDRVYFGCCDKKMYCLSLNGKLIWAFETGNVLTRPPSIYEDVAYFGSYDGNVYAVDADSGKLLWKFNAGSEVIKPVVADNRLYFCTLEGNLFCLNLKGEELWRYKTSNQLFSVPLIENGVVYVGYEDGCLHAVSGETGSLLWKFSTGGWIRAMPAVFYKGKVYFGSIDKNLYALGTDGSLAWRLMMGDVPSVPVVNEGVIYCGSRDDNFYAINAENGNVIWKVSMPNMVVGQACVTDDAIYAGCWDCNLYAISHKGSIIWKFPTNGYLNSGPAFYKGRLYFGSWDCNFYCIDKLGKLVWKFPMSISTQSKLQLEESTITRTLQTVWQVEAEKGEEKYKEGAAEMLGYGTSFSHYIGTGKSDYTAHRKKGYITRKE